MNHYEQSALKYYKDNPSEFLESVLDAIKTNPEYVFEDENELHKKQKGLNNMIQYFESLERYEDCAFLLNIVNRLNEEPNNCSLAK